jgi:murein DD-endopeptidase MepM/ murein hydrolase activator NlpD
VQLILLSRNRAVARCVEINAAKLWLLSALLAAGLIFVAATSIRMTPQTASVAADRAYADLEAELSAQYAELADIRQVSEEHVGALSVRIAELNASVIRLNALGQRLTDMADLDDGEFNFADFPAVGGPAPESADVSAASMPDMMSDFEQLAFAIDSQEQQLMALEGLLMKRKLNDRVQPSGRPVKSGWISSYFGHRADPMTGTRAMHKGIDFAGKYGTEVVAVSDGVVVSSSKRSGFGNTVEIRHGNGYMTRYAHNQKNLVRVGDIVKQGDTIALLGSSGRSTGPHVHFEVWRDGRPVDPARYVQ